VRASSHCQFPELFSEHAFYDTTGDVVEACRRRQQAVRSGSLSRALIGSRSFSGSPFSGLYQAGEGALVVVANTPRQTEALLRTLELESLWEDPRVRDWRNHADVVELLGERLQQALLKRTADAWEALLNEAHVPAGKVRSLPEMMDQPYTAERGFKHEIFHSRTRRDPATPRNRLSRRWPERVCGHTATRAGPAHRRGVAGDRAGRSRNQAPGRGRRGRDAVESVRDDEVENLGLLWELQVDVAISPLALPGPAGPGTIAMNFASASC
jgi:hypothetical protein